MSALVWATLQDALYDAAKAAMPSCAVAWSLPGVAMPVKPCVSLNLTTRDIAPGMPGSDEVQNTATAGTVAYAYHRRHSLSVQVYSDTMHGDGHATVLLAALVRELRTEARILALRTAGCKAWPTSPVRDLSAMLDTRGESRAQLDVTVATLDSATEVVGWIETVPVTGLTPT